MKNTVDVDHIVRGEVKLGLWTCAGGVHGGTGAGGAAYDLAGTIGDGARGVIRGGSGATDGGGGGVDGIDSVDDVCSMDGSRRSIDGGGRTQGVGLASPIWGRCTGVSGTKQFFGL